MSDLHKCRGCGAEFDLDQVLFDDLDAPREEEATQFGVLAGSCPECGEPLDLSLQEIQRILTRNPHP